MLASVMLAIGSNALAQSEFSSGLIGVGVVCKDIEKSLDFYLNVIGMSKVSFFRSVTPFQTSPPAPNT